MQQRAKDNPKIEFLLNTVVEQVCVGVHMFMTSWVMMWLVLRIAVL
jgi:hypothetical protein